MTLVSWVLGKAARLGRPTATSVTVERDLETKMPDGTVLLADRWYSPGTVARAPIVLIRTPYGRRQLGIFGRLFAERGYQAVIQSCRGTFGSGPTFTPFAYEQADGKATLEWLSEQPWWTGGLGMYGASYMGMTQWAVASDPPEYLRALAMQVTAANVRDAAVYPGGSFSLETGAVWVQQMEYQELRPWRLLWVMLRSKRRLSLVYTRLPLQDADTLAHGRVIDFYQDWLAHGEAGDPFWDPVDYSRDLSRVPPTSHVAGWYDLFLPAQVQDFERLVQAGREARITIGPWTHTSPGGGAGAAGMRDALEAFDVHLRGGCGQARDLPVRIFVMGSRRWVDVPSWPPPHTPTRWYLHRGRVLSTGEPGPQGPDRYLYDPADPTPSLGGPTLDPIRAGRKNQRRREVRNDVLSYTTEPLRSDLTVAGPVVAEVWVQSTTGFFDVFARLCDVDARGKSCNVSDGILRVRPGQVEQDGAGVCRVRVPMWPTAQTFGAGHRIRLQLSSAAHPLFARNPGSGEPLGSATRLVASDQSVYHDPEHPSYIELPVSPI